MDADTESEARSVASATRGRLVRRLQRALVVAGLVIALVGGVLLGRWAFEGSGTPPAQIASSSIDITGPDEIEVGQPAVFTAETDGVNSWVWTLPSHRYVSDQATVTITATSPGTAVVVLRSQTPEGEDLEVRHSVQVVE